MSALEDTLLLQIQAAGLPIPERERVVHALLGYRFDLAWEAERLAVEVHGATWAGGRHNRGAGLEQDCLKGALAQLLGWRVIAVTGDMVASGLALRLIEAALGVIEAEAIIRARAQEIAAARSEGAKRGWEIRRAKAGR